MADKLTSECDRALTEVFGAVGLGRFARGVYAQSEDDVIWRGVWVTFNIKNGVLVTQPNVGVFCPVAEKSVSEGLKALHGSEAGRSYFGKLGAPVLTRPLYSLVRSIGENRLPPAYHVANVEQIDEVTKLVRDDFLRAGRRFVDPIDSLPALRDQLMADSATGARMYAISVTYLMNNKRITSDEIDKVLGPQPNTMSREFAEYFKTKFAGASA